MSDDTPEIVVMEIEDVETWWHGGPRIDGDLILPPSVTGAESTFDIAGKIGLRQDGLVSSEHVYLTARRDVATMFACVHRAPWVYEVEPIGGLEIDPDYVAENAEVASVFCDSARIVRRFNPSARDRDGWRRVLGQGVRSSAGFLNPLSI